MTPLARFLARFLPRRLVWIAVACVYAAGIFCVVILGQSSGDGIVYIDIAGNE